MTIFIKDDPDFNKMMDISSKLFKHGFIRFRDDTDSRNYVNYDRDILVKLFNNGTVFSYKFVFISNEKIMTNIIKEFSKLPNNKPSEIMKFKSKISKLNQN